MASSQKTEALLAGEGRCVQNRPLIRGVCGLARSIVVTVSQSVRSNPEFVDGPIHVCGAEGDVLKAALEWVVVTHSRPVDAQS